MSQPATQSCPHCDGTCEEPGAPVDENGYWLCYLCHGKGWVTKDRARIYEKERVDVDSVVEG